MTSSTPSDLEQQILLAIWRSGEEAYGLTIRDELEATAGRVITVGAIYTTLLRLEKKGWVRSRLADPTPTRGGKRKRFFAITPEGIAAVTEARRTLDKLWDGLAVPADGTEP